MAASPSKHERKRSAKALVMEVMIRTGCPRFDNEMENRNIME